MAVGFFALTVRGHAGKSLQCAVQNAPLVRIHGFHRNGTSGLAHMQRIFACKAFNAQTQGVEPGLPLPVVITAFADKSFTFVIKTPPAAVLIKKAIKLDKGSAKPNSDKVGKITRAQLEEIAKGKIKDMNAADIDAAVRTLAGSARSMGVTVEGL